MNKSPFGDLEKDLNKYLTEEGIKAVKEIAETFKPGNKEQFKEVLIKNILIMRDDFTKEELMEAFEKADTLTREYSQ